MDKKTAPNRLMVDEAVQDDNSVVALHPDTMEALELFRGDTVLIKGKRRKDTVCIVLADENVAPNKIRMNKVCLCFALALPLPLLPLPFSILIVYFRLLFGSMSTMGLLRAHDIFVIRWSFSPPCPDPYP